MALFAHFIVLRKQYMYIYDRSQSMEACAVCYQKKTNHPGTPASSVPPGGFPIPTQLFRLTLRVSRFRSDVWIEKGKGYIRDVYSVVGFVSRLLRMQN